MTEHRCWPCRMSGRTFHIPVSESSDWPIFKNHSTSAHGYCLLSCEKEKNSWMCTTFIPHISSLFSSSTMKAQSQCGALPLHSGQDCIHSQHIPRSPHSSLGAYKEAMAEWNTEILPSITGQSSRSMSSDVISESVFLLSWSKRKQRASAGSWHWLIWTASASREHR